MKQDQVILKEQIMTEILKELSQTVFKTNIARFLKEKTRT